MYHYSPSPRYGGKIQLFDMDNSNVQLKVVQQKINKIKSLSENHTNLHRNIC